MHFPALPLETKNFDDNENLINTWIPQAIAFYNHLKANISPESVQSFLILSPRYKNELKTTIKSKQVKRVILACHENIKKVQLPAILNSPGNLVDLAFLLDICLLYSKDPGISKLLKKLLKSDEKLTFMGMTFIEQDLFKALRIGGSHEEFVLDSLLAVTVLLQFIPETHFSNLTISSTKELLKSGFQWMVECGIEFTSDKILTCFSKYWHFLFEKLVFVKVLENPSVKGGHYVEMVAEIIKMNRVAKFYQAEKWSLLDSLKNLAEMNSGYEMAVLELNKIKNPELSPNTTPASELGSVLQPNFLSTSSSSKTVTDAGIETSYRHIKEMLPEIGKFYFEKLCKCLKTTDVEKLTDIILTGDGLPEEMVGVSQSAKTDPDKMELLIGKKHQYNAAKPKVDKSFYDRYQYVSEVEDVAEVKALNSKGEIVSDTTRYQAASENIVSNYVELEAAYEDEYSVHNKNLKSYFDVFTDIFKFKRAV